MLNRLSTASFHGVRRAHLCALPFQNSSIRACFSHALPEANGSRPASASCAAFSCLPFAQSPCIQQRSKCPEGQPWRASYTAAFAGLSLTVAHAAADDDEPMVSDARLNSDDSEVCITAVYGPTCASSLYPDSGTSCCNRSCITLYDCWLAFLGQACSC